MRERHDIPADVEDALISSHVMDDYQNRPAYQRNDYIGWITRAALEATRVKRINQMVDELRTGGVYMKMPHPASRKSG